MNFYQAFSAACFALLALWLVAVQIRSDQWLQDPVRQRRAYGVALHFALPGIMSVLALVDLNSTIFWRVSFIIVAFSGVLILLAVRGFPAPVERGAGRHLSTANRLGLAAYALAILLYLVIGILAIPGGVSVLRTEAVLLTVLVFLAFNVAWLLLFDDKAAAGSVSSPAASASSSAGTASSGTTG